jgi:hypothetical protein
VRAVADGIPQAARRVDNEGKLLYKGRLVLQEADDYEHTLEMETDKCSTRVLILVLQQILSSLTEEAS